MFRKAGFKKMALSFVVAITLVLGMTSIGYCGGGAGAPGDALKESGPSLNAILIINGTLPTNAITTIILVGKCNGQKIGAFENFTGDTRTVPVNIGELDDGDWQPNGQTLLGVSEGDPCFPVHGIDDPGPPRAEDPLTIDNVHSFNRVENSTLHQVTVVADVTIKWLIPR